MKAIIDGKRYNTETAELLAWLPSRGDSRSDFQYEETAVYRTPRGRFFLAGEGGPMTRWARKAGNMWGYGRGIRAIDSEEARELLEGTGSDGMAALERHFAIEEG